MICAVDDWVIGFPSPPKSPRHLQVEASGPCEARAVSMHHGCRSFQVNKLHPTLGMREHTNAAGPC